MLNTIRAFAGEQLAGRGEAAATVSRLNQYLVRLVESVRDDLPGPDHRTVNELLDRERDDIRSAIDWALRTDDAETAARLSAISSTVLRWGPRLCPSSMLLTARTLTPEFSDSCSRVSPAWWRCWRSNCAKDCWFCWSSPT